MIVILSLLGAFVFHIGFLFGANPGTLKNAQLRPNLFVVVSIIWLLSLHQYLLFTGLLRVATWYMLVPIPLVVLLGPAGYLFTRQLITHTKSPARRTRVHYAGGLFMVAFLALMYLPLYQMSHSEKLVLIERIAAGEVSLFLTFLNQDIVHLLGMLPPMMHRPRFWFMVYIAIYLGAVIPLILAEVRKGTSFKRITSGLIIWFMQVFLFGSELILTVIAIMVGSEMTPTVPFREVQSLAFLVVIIIITVLLWMAAQPSRSWSWLLEIPDHPIVVPTFSDEVSKVQQFYAQTDGENATATRLRKVLLANAFNAGTTRADLAEAFNVSDRQFSRMTLEQVGVSPHQLLQITRLEAARSSMMHGDKIIEAASKVGFSSLYSFRQQCKRYYNCTPSDSAFTAGTAWVRL